MKLLTVAVPSYNMERYLRQCLNSFADERLIPEVEVLIVDDGSTDGTAAIAREYADRWPALFRLISKENGGHGSAVNAAMEQAEGKYFRIVDADDWVNTENLALLLKVLRTSDADLVLDEKTEVDMRTNSEQYFAFPDDMPAGRAVPIEQVSAQRFRYHFSLHTLNVRLALLREHQVRLLEHTFYVDSQYVLQATSFARSALVTRLGVYFYRVGNAAQSVDHKNYVRRYKDHDRVLRACLRFLKEGGVPPERSGFAAHSVLLLIHTQLNIALLYNPDQREGREQAAQLRALLKEEAPELARAARRRYAQAMILNRLGVGEEGLARLKRLMGRK